MDLDNFYMSIAHHAADQSHAIRRKVGCVVAKGDRILSYAWNGMPAGFHNDCEHSVLTKDPETGILQFQLLTKPGVTHAEVNAIGKLAAAGISCAGATLYLTLSPCVPCANLIQRSGIERVVYETQYRDVEGINLLTGCGIAVQKF
ncbi:deoxycytidylate deaminase domain like protein [Ralstonia phage phiRSL1]|uniref:Deoxycytidylate deaminase domain like protein n=1 Tax=Ralstonia phage phiRSL1 TaxID=1980924 RepID=B2ZXY2_9CAUD|nr:dCMP deaminase [Ralstonia phage phiRSL1]BAG41558.2 deoxycytidylate deaminase domain like protein [Ralstonia phage phiRSL1]